MSGQTPLAGQDPSLHLQVEADQADSSKSDDGARRSNILLRAGIGSLCLLLFGLAAWAYLPDALQASSAKPSGSVEAFAFNPALPAVRGMPSGVRPASRSHGLRGTPRPRVVTQMAFGWPKGARDRARVVTQMTQKDDVDALVGAGMARFFIEENIKIVSGKKEKNRQAQFFSDLSMLEAMGTSSGDLTFVIKMIPQLLFMSAKLQEKAKGPPKDLLFPDALEMDLHASSVISTWSQITNSYATSPNRIAESSKEYDGALGRRLQALGLMALEIQMSLPDEVLALVRKADAEEICIINPDATGCDCDKNLEGDFVATNTPDDVFAMATVSKKMWKLKGVEESWKLGWFANSQGFSYADTAQIYENGYVPVFEIGNVASRPSRSTGLGKEFLLQIMRHAAATGHLVILSETSPRLTDYYQEMGFVPMRTIEGTVLVYSKPIEATPEDTMFEIGRLHRLGPQP